MWLLLPSIRLILSSIIFKSDLEFNITLTATAFSGDGSALTGISGGDVVSDTTPQLGGSLDAQTNNLNLIGLSKSSAADLEKYCKYTK